MMICARSLARSLTKTYEQQIVSEAAKSLRLNEVTCENKCDKAIKLYICTSQTNLSPQLVPSVVIYIYIYMFVRVPINANKTNGRVTKRHWQQEQQKLYILYLQLIQLIHSFSLSPSLFTLDCFALLWQ